MHSGGEYGYPLPFVGEQPPGRDALAPLSEAEALSGEVAAERLAAVPPGPDPVKQGEKAFRAMGSFARVAPAIVFHGPPIMFLDPKRERGHPAMDHHE